jgi:hypothetical protein
MDGKNKDTSRSICCCCPKAALSVYNSNCCDIYCAIGNRIGILPEEAFNKRMHRLIFMNMAEPDWFMRVMVLGAQAVLFNGFFLSYIMSPRICLRFVGYLEEEADITYTRANKGRTTSMVKSRRLKLASSTGRCPSISRRSVTC